MMQSNQPVVYSQAKSDGARLRTGLVFLDGPRASGKTTTGTNLVSALEGLGWNARYFKKGSPDPEDEHRNMLDHLMRFLAEIQDGTVDVIVVDRFVATELVFGLYTGRTRPEKLIRYCIDIALRIEALGALNQIILPPQTILEWRMATRPDDHSWDMEQDRIQDFWMMAARALPGVTVQPEPLQELHVPIINWLLPKVPTRSPLSGDPRFLIADPHHDR